MRSGWGRENRPPGIADVGQEALSFIDRRSDDSVQDLGGPVGTLPVLVRPFSVRRNS